MYLDFLQNLTFFEHCKQFIYLVMLKLNQVVFKGEEYYVAVRKYELYF